MTLAEALVAGEQHAPGDHATFRWYYRVGALAWSTFTAWIVHAEAAGLTVRREHRRGVLIREGWITLDGPWGVVRRHLRIWRRLAEGNA